MDRQMDRWIQLDRWIDGQMDRYNYGQIVSQIDEQMDRGQMDRGQMDRQINGQIDRWIDRMMDR